MRHILGVLTHGLFTFILIVTPVQAVERGVYKEIRGRFEGRALRLRVDLREASTAGSPNTISTEGVGYGRESARILFRRMETVFVERVTNDGKRRLDLTIYRSREEADRIRSAAVPPSMGANPNFGGTIAAFAQMGSTGVVLEVRAGKKEPEVQLRETEELLDRLFFFESEPTREELEDYVRRNAGLSISRLREITGLPAEVVRAVLDEVRNPAGRSDR